MNVGVPGKADAFPGFLFLGQRTLAPAVLIFILGLCYTLTLAPDLTWAHFSADGGDLIVAAATGGVPHPGGYPLYLLLARLFQFIPVGTLAFRTNILSAVCTTLAALVLYKFLLHQFHKQFYSTLVALIGGLAYGLAPFVWGQAIVTEVYALHGLLMIACLYVLELEMGSRGDWFCGFVFGIAACNHLSALLIYPLIFLNHQGRISISPGQFLMRCFGILNGLSLYLLLPLRASLEPPVNWGNASTLDGFIWLVTGQLYRDYLFAPSAIDVVQRIRAFAGLLLEQYTWIGMLLAIYGVFSTFCRRVLVATLWMGFTFTAFALFYGSKDSQVYLLPVWLILAVWLAHGLADLFDLLSNHPKTQVVIVGTVFVALLIRIPADLKSVDLSQDRSALDFIEQSLTEIPRDALVFLRGDKQIFSLWYAHFALNRRQDVIFVANDLLPFGWYIETLRQNYLSMKIPETNIIHSADLIRANSERAICYISDDIFMCNPVNP